MTVSGGQTPEPVERGRAERTRPQGGIGRVVWPRGRWGRLARIGLVVVIFCFAGAWVVLRGPVAKALVLPRIAEALGGEVTARSVSINLNGTIVVRGLVVRAPGLEGPAGEVLRARRSVIVLDGLHEGAQPRSVFIRRASLRVSQDLASGVVNLERLGIFRREKDVLGQPPVVQIEQVEVELGEHEREMYRPLKVIMVDGMVRPGDAPGSVFIDLEERAGPGVPLVVRGRADGQGIEVLVEGVELSDWPPSAVPGSLRETFALLNLQGRVGGTRLEIDARGEISVRAELLGVAVTLPFDVEGNYAPSGPLARMTEVRGTVEFAADGVRAELTGMLEDLPYEVDLEYAGLAATSPFSCVLRTRGYALSQDPRLVPLLPSIVGERLQTFTQPTGVLDADVVIERRAGQDGATIDVRGWIEISGGIASYERFPYAFSDMTGRVYFDNSVIVIEEITGVAATGARLRATGMIVPPSDSAEIDLTIRVEDVPLDETLRYGMQRRGRVLDALVSSSRERELVEAGLLDAGFVPGGDADLDIFVHRPLGPDVEWTYSVGISLDRVGVLPEAFPYPLIGEGVVIGLKGDEARLIRGMFYGLAGGMVRLGLTADIGAEDTEVSVSVVAHDVPVDDRLVHAVDATMGDGSWSVPARGLGLGGVIDADLHVLDRDDGGIDLTGVVEGRGMRLAPPGGAIGVESLELRVGIGSGAIEADAIGVLADFVTGAVSPVWGDVRIDLATRCFDGVVVGGGVEAHMRVDQFVEPLWPEVARTWRALVETYRPSASADVVVDFACREGDTPRVSAAVIPRSDIELEMLGAAVRLDAPTGRVVVMPGEAVLFAGFGGAMSVGGETAGRVSIQGKWPLTNLPRLDDDAVRVFVDGAGFASAFAHRIVREAAGEEAHARYASAQPAGLFDATAVMRMGSGGVEFEGSVRPRSLAFAMSGKRIEFERLSGFAELALDGSIVVDVVGHAPTWEATARGVVEGDSGQGYRFEGSGTIRSEGLSDDLKALLPQALVDAARAIDLDVERLEVRIDALAGHWGHEGSQSSEVTARGSAWFAGAKIDAGIEIAQADGRLVFSAVDWEGAGSSAELVVLMDRCTLGGMRATQAEVQILVESGGGVVQIVGFEADCHGGRISGSGRVEPAEGRGRRYQVDVAASGVRLASVLADISENGRNDARAVDRPDDSRGTMSGSLSLRGEMDRAGSRRGRGNVLIGQGAVVDMPLLMPLIKMGNLQMPTTGEVDLAMASFFIQGDVVTFDELSAFADTVEVFGFGTLHWPDRELDLMFMSRSVREIPVVSRLVEGLRDELFAAKVTGRLGAQRIEGSTLRGVRSALGMLFRDTPTAQDERLAEIERRARENRDRARRASDRIRRSGDGSTVLGQSPHEGR
ncbi:MAG: hypothetical protein KIT24_01560 [Phycisphaeraceae bacterium]|nr:hypothetical protein [Phycisphaeraceae bacterium]